MTETFHARLVADFRADDPVGRGLQRCWADVSNAGGAVGFPFPPVSDEQVGTATRRLAEEVNAGAVRLFVAEEHDDVVGWVLLRCNPSKLTQHWATVERLQSRPERRGSGVGRLLLEALSDHARSIGIEHLRLVLRGGENLEAFYQRLGWKEIGRHPGALRLSKGDNRDEVSMSFDFLGAEGAI